jgi:hypothetical protein
MKPGFQSNLFYASRLDLRACERETEVEDAEGRRDSEGRRRRGDAPPTLAFERSAHIVWGVSTVRRRFGPG